MRTFLLAFVTGLALAGAMLGLGGQSLAKTEFRAEPDQRALLPAAATPTDDRAAVRTPTPGAHSDANSSAVTVRLNMNLIRGEPTRVCTTDPDVYPKLEAAVSIWRTALQDLITFQGADGPFLLHRSLSGRPQTCPVSGPNDVDVLVRKSAEPGRAYYFNRQDSPPRKLFAATDDYIPESVRSEHHAVISLNSSLEVLTATLVHELGHVLGLSDYEFCGLLRDLDTATPAWSFGGGTAPHGFGLDGQAIGAAPLALSPSPSSRHCVVHEQHLPITWEVSGGTRAVPVTVGGQPSSGGDAPARLPGHAGGEHDHRAGAGPGAAAGHGQAGCDPDRDAAPGSERGRNAGEL